MLATNIRLDQILLHNDTRMQGRAWIENNIPEGTKILVLAPLTRISSVAKAVTEQETIDPHSLRKIDHAERTLSKNFSRHPQYHALNLYSVGRDANNFYNN